MEERVAELEARVRHLEQEMETSYEEEQFKQRVRNIFSYGDASIEFRDGHYGYFARVTGLDGDQIQVALDRINNTDYGCAVTETASGPGMEVWSEPEV